MRERFFLKTFFLSWFLHPFAFQTLAHRQQRLGAIGRSRDGAGVVDDEVGAAGELCGDFGAHDATLGEHERDGGRSRER